MAQKILGKCFSVNHQYLNKFSNGFWDNQTPVVWSEPNTICPADNATAGSLGRRKAGQLRFGFVAVSAGHIVYLKLKPETLQCIKQFLANSCEF
jgi:hypothetical protein